MLRLGETVSVPAGDYEDVLVTRDWNPLEPEIVEQKYYAPGVGVVVEQARSRARPASAELLEADLTA